MTDGSRAGHDRPDATRAAATVSPGDNRYRAFLALSGDGIAHMELDEPLDVAAAEDEQVDHILRNSRVAECNEPFAQVYGLAVADLAGQRLGDFFPADNPARLQGIRAFVRSRYQLVYSEEEHALADGSLRWMSGSASGAVVDGRLRDYWLCLRDTSERKRADADRERRGRILEAVAFSSVRLLQPGTWRAQADEVLARLGHAAEAARAWIVEKEDGPGGSTSIVFRFTWGVPGAELSIEDPRLRGGVSLQAAGLGRLEAELRAGRPVLTSVRELSQSEQSFPRNLGSKSFAAVPVFSNGQWWGLLGFGETRYEREWSASEVEGLKAAAGVLGAAIERERADEALRESEDELRQTAGQWRQTFDALDLGIVLADAAGRIVRLNRGALDLAPSAAFRDMVGRKLDELSDREPWRTVLEVHRQVAEGQASVTSEAREASSGRSFYFLGSPWLRAGQPPGCVLTFRDETDFTIMQTQLRRARTMEAMGSLVAGVAHEVRNPLFSISATVDALESELGARPEFTEYAVLLRSQVDRLSQLMRDLLDYGRPSVLRRGSTRLAEVVRRAVRSCTTLARERQVRVEEDLAPELPALDVDGARVEQALENLLANAIQHAPVGSVVRVGGRFDTTGREPRARITVEDDGPGLPAESLGRIFEPFFSRRKGGTGLGLSIVQRVAEVHGGDVTAENRPGGGACFTLLLPLGGVAVQAEGGHDA